MGEHPSNIRGLMDSSITDAVIQGITVAKHECPPDRVAMMARLEELQKGWDTRLAHQKQVIENLDTARKTAEEKLAAWHEFGRYVAALTPSVFYDLSCQALELLHQQGVEE